MRASGRFTRAATAALAMAAVVASACDSGGAEQAVPGEVAEPAPVTAPTVPVAPTTVVTAPASTPATTPVTTAPTPATPAPPPPPGLHPGMQGDGVRILQERLVALHYDPGAVDGRYGAGVVHAVMAFQKTNGLPRNGHASPAVLAALKTATDPPAMLPDGGPTRVEIDFKRQVLFFWRDGALVRILPVSTGSGRKYCENGHCGVAVTPSGSYRIERRIKGKRKSDLGILYNPLYFYGGYAIHGSPSVPARPASHGCVRVPMHSSLWVFDNVANGTPVYLIGGKHPAVPFPPPAPPAPPTPTTEPVPSAESTPPPDAPATAQGQTSPPAEQPQPAPAPPPPSEPAPTEPPPPPS